MRKLIIILSIIIVLFVVIIPSTFYVVDQTKQAIVLRFGRVVKVITEPGVHFKQPFVDNVIYFEKRILLYDIEPEKIITADKKTLIIDTYALWRIRDPYKFLTSMRGVKIAQTRIDDIVYSHIRDVFAKGSFEEVVSLKREEFLNEVTKLCREDLDPFGIEIVDVRVKHADLPEENTESVYNRMKEERHSIAAKIRAEGEKEAEMIKAEADLEARTILAKAYEEAQTIKGTGEASAAAIYAKAYSVDEDFYEFWRKIQLYENVKGAVILGPETKFLKDLIEEK
ncbi:MAG: protease modulator HflC [Thermotogaceae bacterium]|nr:protease modulator HflC [Thermotogaceae bacterium]